MKQAAVAKRYILVWLWNAQSIARVPYPVISIFPIAVILVASQILPASCNSKLK
jgi:hypothetical protein